MNIYVLYGIFIHWQHKKLKCLEKYRTSGTTTLEVKLLQKVETLREVVLHEIFLDLNKAYDAFEMSR